MKDEISFVLFIVVVINVVVLFWLYTIQRNANKIKNLLFAIAQLQYKQANKEGDETKLEDIYNKGKGL